MSRRARRVGALALAGWAALSAWTFDTRVAQAAPTLWERAREPGSSLRTRALLRAEQLFDAAFESRFDPDAFRELSLGSASLLELGGGKHLEPWQRVLLGRALLDARAGREREAMQLVLRALAELPESDYKRESWFDLGIAAMLAGDLPLADRAFTASLALSWDQDDRASMHRNRGKARMLAGDLRGAVNDFKAAVQLARRADFVALSLFGLGVALERSGDYPQGLAQVSKGRAIRLPVPPYPSESALDLPTLTWVPSYDVHYFRAFAAMSEAHAAQDRDRDTAASSYEEALSHWSQYLPAAEAARDKFLSNARRHQQRCRDALDDLARELETPPMRRSRRAR
jgi:tetratricopeptide (TPR) repeat protein